MELRGNLATEARHNWLRSKLDKHGSVRIGEAAAELQVSEMTIRRDLQALEAIGVVRRVRGGAVAVGPVAFVDRHRRRAPAKAAIAAKLVPMVPESGAIGLDASSTLMRLGSAIHSARELTIITNGPDAFGSLQKKPGVTAVLTGGQLDDRTGSLIGPLACRAARNLLISTLFMSAAGVDPETGTSEATLDEADVKLAMADTAAEVVLAIDSSKLGARAVALGVEWDRVTTLVTELAPKDKRLDPYRKLVADIR